MFENCRLSTNTIIVGLAVATVSVYYLYTKYHDTVYLYHDDAKSLDSSTAKLVNIDIKLNKLLAEIEKYGTLIKDIFQPSDATTTEEIPAPTAKKQPK